MKRVLGMDGGDDCTPMWMYLIPMNYTLKNGSDGKFYVACVLPQFLKKVSPHESKEEKNNTG